MNREVILGSGVAHAGGSSSAESVTPPEAMASLARLERATHCLEDTDDASRSWEAIKIALSKR